jgi:tetratricopeptide (TPR) repeat protein
MKALLLVALACSAMAQPNDLMARMQAITRDLGISCNYCHSAERGSGQPEPKKEIARAMIAMTRDINARIREAAGSGATEVQCVTCHRGVPIPRQLSQILSQTIREKGAAEAASQYRDLRQRYYGRQAYDFGEETLVGLAQPLSNGRPDDAIVLLQLNLDYYPQSAKTYAALAYAYTRKFDDTTAITYLEKALQIEPENGVVRGQLEQLKSYRRNR